MKIKKLVNCLIIFLLPLILAGCFNYKDINKVSFATSIIFDKNEYDNVVVYVDCVKPYRSTNDSSDKGRRIIYKGTGKTTLEAINDINLASSYDLNFTQTRAYIFTEKAAAKEGGIKDYLDLINNNQQLSIKPNMFVYYGEVEELLKITSGDEEYLGLYLETITDKNSSNSRAMQANVNDYLSNSLMASNTTVIGVIDIKQDALDKKVEINGGAILKDNILKERIPTKDAFSYNLLMDNVKGGTLEIANPQSNEDFITLNIEGSKTKSKIRYDGNKVTLVKDLEMNLSIGEAQGRLLIDKDVLDYIKVNKEIEIKEYLINIFNKYKEKGLDVFDVDRLLEVHYPKAVIDNVIDKINLEVNVSINIDGTGKIKDSL